MFEFETTKDRRSDPAVRHYLATIGKYPLLEPAQEREVARRSREGDGNAFDALVNANLRFVVSVARGYLNRGLGYMDLIAEGNVGLITAARRFDETRGCRFVTYAVWWIRQAIREALQNQVRTVRLPVNQSRLIPAMIEVEHRLAQSTASTVPVEALADALGVPPTKLLQIRAASGPNVSLDAPDDEAGHATKDSLMDSDWRSPLDLLVDEEADRGVADAITRLDAREQAIIAGHYGFDGGEDRPLVAIGTTMSLSRERTRQLRNRALRKLRDRLGSLSASGGD